MGWTDGRNKEKWTNLAIKEVAPRVRGGFLTERFKVPKTGHRLKVDGDVAKSDSWIKTSGTSWCWQSFRTCWGTETQAVATLMGRGVRADICEAKQSSHGTRDEVVSCPGNFYLVIQSIDGSSNHAQQRRSREASLRSTTQTGD